MQPKLSVLIPTLNEEKYVCVILEDLTKQTFKDFEVIVADGASTDKTEEVVRSFEDKLNIKYLKSPKTNVSNQRNYAAENATTDHFVFFDADVSIKPNFLKKLYSRIEKNFSGVLTSWNIPRSKSLFDMCVYLIYNLLTWVVSYTKRVGATGVFIYSSRDAFEKIGGFDPSITFAEDSHFARQVKAAGFRFRFVATPPIYVSTRRFAREGRLSSVIKFVRFNLYTMKHGPVRDNTKFEHKMGGDI